MAMTTAPAKVRNIVPTAETEDDAAVLSAGEAKHRRSGPRKREAWRTAKPAPELRGKIGNVPANAAG